MVAETRKRKKRKKEKHGDLCDGNIAQKQNKKYKAIMSIWKPKYVV